MLKGTVLIVVAWAIHTTFVKRHLSNLPLLKKVVVYFETVNSNYEFNASNSVSIAFVFEESNSIIFLTIFCFILYW